MWRRLGCALGISAAFGLMLGLHWTSGPLSVVVRCLAIGTMAVTAFTLFERWPKKLPRFIARWVLQVAAVAAVIPFTTLIIYIYSTERGAPPFWNDDGRREGFLTLTILGVLIAPWTAVAALVRQKEALAEHHAVEARLRLLQAQVAPHFLFNTLANVQALVDAGSPQASALLRSLIAYLRAAVPRLDQSDATLGRELELVRAYLDLMHMRMPDRLQFGLHVDESALALPCPPTTLLTLVENAVRHGIDPSEEGGRIDVFISRYGRRCIVRVIDTGAGFGPTEHGLGTGLAMLRERLQLMFGSAAQLRLSAHAPRGVCAELEWPI